MRKKRYILVVFLCLAWTVFIFSRSAKSGVASTQESQAALDVIARIFNFFGIQKLPSEHLLRKLGHFAEYAILGVLAFVSAKLFLHRFFPLVGWGYCVTVAVFDEFLVQNLAVERGPSVVDVLIDALGAVTAVFLLFLWHNRAKIFTRSLRKKP